MGNLCCIKQSKSDLHESGPDGSIKSDDQNERLLHTSNSTSSPPETPPLSKEDQNKIIEEDTPPHSSLEEDTNHQKHLHQENEITQDEEVETEDRVQVRSHQVPVRRNSLVNELKTSFPNGYADLTRRRTKESLNNSIRKSNQNPQLNFLHSLRGLEEKLRKEQKSIVNHSELSMPNVLEQCKEKLADIGTSLQPEVIDTRREVYCKLKACFSLFVKEEMVTMPEFHEDGFRNSIRTAGLMKLRGFNQELKLLESNVEENKDIEKAQSMIEEILVSLENINSDDHQQQLILKNHLKEKCLSLIKECILKSI